MSESIFGRVAATLPLAWLLAVQIGLAAPPTLDGLLPAGGQSGAEIPLVTVIGKAEPWPCLIWCSNPGVQFQPGEKAGQYRVNIAKDAAPGPCFVRLHNAEGVSEPRFFVVGGEREIVEDAKADNDQPATATAVGPLPVMVNGTLEKAQDYDVWKLSLKKGQTLRARLDGYGLRSGMDPFLALFDGKGHRIALASDGPRNLDPWLAFAVPSDGDYGIGVMAIDHPPGSSVSFSGAAKAVYRLSLAVGAEKAVADTIPPAGDGPVALPISGFGTLSRPGESDRVKFRGTKGQNLRVVAEAVGPGFSTDPVLVLENADNSVIREVDDLRTSRDAQSVFKVPADGEYACRVGDRFHRGGPEMRYRLEIKETEPDFTLSADLAAYSGKAGETVAVKLKLTRANGHTEAVTATATGLPAGATAAPVKWDAKGTDGTLEIKLGGDAVPFSGPFRVTAAEEAGQKRTRLAAFSFQSADARGPYLIDETADLWLTVLPKSGKPDEKKTEPSKGK